MGSSCAEWRGVASVMAAGGSRARADYDYLIKLLLIGDSGMCRVPQCETICGCSECFIAGGLAARQNVHRYGL